MARKSGQPPESIALAMQALANIARVNVVGQLVHVATEDAWALPLVLRCHQVSKYVPSVSRWFALLDEVYPNGHVRLYPSRDEGISYTFPHQDRNQGQHKKNPWRTGKLCLDSPVQRLGRIACGPEPKDDVDRRLAWHVERALAWLDAAAENQLMDEADPFELPHRPADVMVATYRVGHDESANSFPLWDPFLGKAGTVRWASVSGTDKSIFVHRFLDEEGLEIRGSERQARPEELQVGYWWLWPEPIVLKPWCIPGSWGELRKVAEDQQVDFDQILKPMVLKSRGKKRAVLLLGYPIPSRWRGEPVEVHWQALLLPEIPKKLTPRKGFRANQHAYWRHLTQGPQALLRDGRRLEYLITENWHPDRIQARGRISEPTRKKSAAIIGVGALGSCVAELLARVGMLDLLLIDHDLLEPGNLARHTLTASALSQNKAEAVAKRLQIVSPTAVVSFLDDRLPSTPENARELLEHYDVIIDCTAEDEVLATLGDATWTLPKLFLSASVGYEARRVFIYCAWGRSFPYERFCDDMGSWMTTERKRWSNAGETLEGTGCWSPVFPARCDDIWMAAVATVKTLESTLSDGQADTTLHVLEQRTGEIGYRRLTDKER